MSDNTLVYVVGPSTEYANWIPKVKLTKNMQEADLVLFTGGEDVSPSLYGEPIGSKTSFNLIRDMREVEEYEVARGLNKPMLGICRGSQFLCVMSGGRLVQHQANRFSIHPIWTSNGKMIDITSTHHQAQYPYEMKDGSYKLLGWTENLSKFHLNGYDKEISEKPFKEAEIVFYPYTNCLGIQGHPEYIWREREDFKETFDYLHDLLNKFLKKTIKL